MDKEMKAGETYTAGELANNESWQLARPRLSVRPEGGRALYDEFQDGGSQTLLVCRIESNLHVVRRRVHHTKRFTLVVNE